MTQNTLSDEIEGILANIDTKYPHLYPLEYIRNGMPAAVTWGAFREELRQSLRSIAEKTVEAVTVEKKWDGYFLGTDDSPEVKAYNQAITEQSKLASHWLGEEEV